MGKIEVWGANQKIWCLFPCFYPWTVRSESILLTLCMKAVRLNLLTNPKLTSWWHVPMIVHVTITQLGGKNLNFWVNWEIWNNYRDLSIANIARLASKKSLYVVICPSDGTYNHLTYFEEEKSMWSEPKDMVLVWHVLFYPWTVGSDSIFRTLCMKAVRLNLLTNPKLTSWWYVPMIVHVTIRQLGGKN